MLSTAIEPTEATPARPATSIVLRHAEPTDAPMLHRLFAEPAVLRNTGWLTSPLAPLAETERALAEANANGHFLVAVAGDRVVGSVGLALGRQPLRRHVATLGSMAVADAWRGRGIGARLVDAALDLADNWLNVSRVELIVRVDNVAAIGLYSRFGFKIEGTLPEWGIRDGEMIDVHTMARRWRPARVA